MRKIIFILSILFSSLLFLQCTSNEKALNKKLEEMAANLNESAPVLLDQYTRFEKAVVTSENIFQYHYTVLNTSNPDSLVENGLRLLKENIGKEYALNADLRIFKENNVTIEYVYNNENGQIVRSLQIGPEDYH